jgi:hypothetical protein
VCVIEGERTGGRLQLRRPPARLAIEVGKARRVEGRHEGAAASYRRGRNAGCGDMDGGGGDWNGRGGGYVGRASGGSAGGVGGEWRWMRGGGGGREEDGNSD